MRKTKQELLKPPKKKFKLKAAMPVYLMLLPGLLYMLLIIASFTDNEWAELNGYSYFPQALSLEAYKYILASLDTIGRAYLMTIIVTAVGTFLKHYNYIAVCLGPLQGWAARN